MAANFGITDHSPVGRGGAAAYRAAKYFRSTGRVLVIVGVAIDIVSIARSNKPLRRATEAVAGWAGAWIGCKVVGAGGAALGLAATPLGSAAVGFGGCIVGGIGGYALGSRVGREVYDWAEGTVFTALPEIAR